MSLQMTQFHSSLWLSNIPLRVCLTSSLAIPLLMELLSVLKWCLAWIFVDCFDSADHSHCAVIIELFVDQSVGSGVILLDHAESAQPSARAKLVMSILEADTAKKSSLLRE